MKRKQRSDLPEKAQMAKYYEMDGALRAYANRMAVLGLASGAVAAISLGLFAYVRLQPPVVIRVDQAGEANVVGGDTVRVNKGLLLAGTASAGSSEPAASAPTDVEGRAVVRKFLQTYLTYTPANVERQFADALNMMTLNFRTLTMNKLREDDTLGRIKTDSITSSIRIRSIEPVAGQPWVYQVFAAKEIHRITSQRIEQTEKMVCRYQVRLVFTGRTQFQPTGLLVGEFWEQQMVGERNIDLDQRSTLLDR
ncbi:MAG: hypothetical protein J0H49_13820 [Acidobacteria bacterium]|nr:hypothetical protein [Acidobacteriota bacterium]